VLIANYHAPQHSNDETISTLTRFGITGIRLQTEVFNAKLYFEMLSIAPVGELMRMTQFKASEDSKQTAHMLTYPVLMAHDVVGYNEICVGEDQTQHLEYARKLIKRHGRLFNVGHVIPAARNVGGRIKDFRRPEMKMSKSSPDGCIFLDDSKDEIAKKVRSAVMDELGRTNLVHLYALLTDEVAPEGNLAFKEKLTEKLEELLK
jgi:tryptophanyl-tRNA synthetase